MIIRIIARAAQRYLEGALPLPTPGRWGLTPRSGPIVKITLGSHCAKPCLIPLPEAPDTKGEPPHTTRAMYVSEY